MNIPGVSDVQIGHVGNVMQDPSQQDVGDGSASGEHEFGHARADAWNEAVSDRRDGGLLAFKPRLAPLTRAADARRLRPSAWCKEVMRGYWWNGISTRQTDLHEWD